MVEVTRKSDREMMIWQYRQWQMSNATELYHVYGRFSKAKIEAMDYCKKLMHSLGGKDLKICSHNDQSFSVGFEFPSPTTGAICFAYITKNYDRFIELTWKDGKLV